VVSTGTSPKSPMPGVHQRIHRTGTQQWFSKNVYLIHRRLDAGDAFRSL
jgi:hypothetical protein